MMSLARSFAESQDQTNTETLHQRQGKKPLPPNMDQARAKVENFVQAIVTSSDTATLFPVMVLIQNPDTQQYSNDPRVVDTSLKVAQAQNLISAVQNGTIKEKVNEEFGAHPEAAKEITTFYEKNFLKLGLDTVAAELELPGLPNQVYTQALLFDSEQNVLSDNVKTNQLVKDAAQFASQSGKISEAEAKKKLQHALEKTIEQGNYSSHEELKQSLEEAVKEEFSDNPELAASVSNYLSTNILQEALKNFSSDELFDITKVRPEALEDSIMQSILKAFSDSEKRISEAKAAKAAADAVISAARKKEIKHEDEVRSIIQDSLKDQIAGISDILAEQVASQVDLRPPKSGPLYDGKGVVLHPDEFKAQLSAAITNHTGLPNTSPVHTAIFEVVGIKSGDDGVGMNELINKTYKEDQESPPSYLAPDAQTAINEMNDNLLDPAKSLVLAWSSMLKNNNEGKKSIDIPA
jgi:hypothetical protein